jgi:hypothetical protein
MNGHSLLLMAALLTSAMPAQAQAQDPPLFSAFKAYCLKAGGDADQIKLAVEMRGGKPANHPSGITATPWPMTATNWDITVLGHKMNLSVGTSRPAKGPATTNCAISSYSDESDSMEALQKWAGVPRDPNHHSQSSIIFIWMARRTNPLQTKIPSALPKNAEIFGH